MAASGKSGRDTIPIQIDVVLQGVARGEETPTLHAYAFSRGGRLLDRAPLDKEGRAKLSLPIQADRTEARVLVGPPIEGEGIQQELFRRGAREARVRYARGDKELRSRFEILRDDWVRWLGRICCVNGKLLKHVHSGGMSMDYPVCHATVEIYEVDPFHVILPRLPIEDLEWLKRLLDPRLEVPPLRRPPLPDPPPEFEMFDLETFRESAPDELCFHAMNLGNEAFRAQLLEHWDYLRPLFCWYWPRFVTMTKLGEVETEECGEFRFCFFQSVFNRDQPDLYFKATRRVFGIDIDLYAPKPIACHTYWNYECGTEVTLYTSSPWAITCSPCPPVVAGDNWVLFMAVGNLSPRRIYGASSALSGATNATNRGLTAGGEPFGGTVGFRLDFDPSLRDDLGVRYYKIAYRKVGTLTWLELPTECFRYYAHMVSGTLVLDPFRLGPHPPIGGVTNLFEIPPAAPPVGIWVYPDVTLHHANAFMPTDTLVAPGDSGKYEIKLDLYDAAGAMVDIAAKGIRYFVPSVELLTGTITTDDASIPALNLVQGNSLILTLHVDTNHCTSSVVAPRLNGVPAGDDCGVMPYNPASPGTVTMDFTAHHPNGFATYHFQLYRGIHYLAPPSVSGPVGSGSFSISPTAASLLGGCVTAGFSESVFCWATATNGWSRQSQYDPSPNPKSFGFVLTPGPGVTP